MERHEQRNNIFVASQFWSLASGTKSYCRDRASCIYCILSRAISSLTGVFGQRLAWGNTAGTRMYHIRLCETRIKCRIREEALSRYPGIFHVRVSQE